MTEAQENEEAPRGASRRQFLGYGTLAALGVSAIDLAIQPRSADAAVQWLHPFTVRGTITSRFGNRVHPIYGDVRLHDGIDYFPPGSGTPVRSVAAGTVRSAGVVNGYGTRVTIDHADGYQTLYGHMQSGSIRVAVGQVISAGTVVGLLGSTGTSTDPHLHLMMHLNGAPIDPTSRVDQAPLPTNTPTPTTPEEAEHLMANGESYTIYKRAGTGRYFAACAGRYVPIGSTLTAQTGLDGQRVIDLLMADGAKFRELSAADYDSLNILYAVVAEKAAAQS